MRRKTSERNKSKRSPEKSPEKSTRKSHRHSRRRRKSSSSSSDDEKPLSKSSADPKATDKVETDLKSAEMVVKTDVESDVSAGSSKRNSKKAEPEVKVDTEVPSSSEKPNEWKEDTEFWNSSETKKEEPSEEDKDKEGGIMWKVQSANGAGGEIQKLKICRQRPAEAGDSGEATKKKVTRSSDGNSSRGTDDSVHEDAEKDSKKSKHRTRTSSRNSPSVVCDVSESTPTKIKIINMSNLEKKSGDESNCVSEIPTPAEEATKEVNVVQDILNSDIPLPDDDKRPVEKESVPVPSLDEIQVPPEKESNITVEDNSKAVETTSVSMDLSQIPEPADEPKKEKTPEVVEKVEVTDAVKEDEEMKPKESNEKEKKKHSSDSDSRSNSSSDSESEKQRKSPRQRSKVKLKRRNSQPPTESAKVESSDSEEETAKTEKLKESTSSLPKENRTNDTSEVAEASEGASEQKLPRKRRWGASKSIRPNKKPLVSISTNSLKDLVPGAMPVPTEELQLSVEEEEEGQLNDDDEDDIAIINITEEVIEEKPVEAEVVVEEKKRESRKEKEKIEEVRRKIEKTEKINKSETVNNKTSSQRRISLITDDTRKLARSPSPPRRRPSNVLYITNLVRPFTVQQLKNLLLRTGTISENGFWIDNIKSKCYVEYTTEDAAVETRHALHGVRWPVSNPKTLVVEFSTHDDMVMAQTLAEETEPIPRKAEPLIVDRSVEGWLADQARLKGQGDRPARRVMAAVREWDVGKPEHPDEIIEQDLRLKERQREQERRMRKERSHRSATPDTAEIPVRKQRRKEEDAPAKLLDDLFRKTKSSPCIYWLPLTQEQIAVKEEIRRQHMAEHERRVAELKKADQARRDRERRNRK